MTIQPISNKVISLNSQEIKFLCNLLEKEKKVCRRSLLSMGRWTDRLEKHVKILQGLVDKIERKV